MGFLKDLLESYNQAEKLGLIDKHEANKTTILPLYHNSMNSTGSNIAIVRLNQDSKVMNAEYMLKKDDDSYLSDSTIIFPVTLDSGTRTSGASPHPIVDNLSYLTPFNENKYNLYLRGLRDFYDYVSDQEVKSFLKVIINAVENPEFYLNVVKKLYSPYDLTVDGLKIKYIDSEDKDKEKTVDLKDVYLTFEVIDQNQGMILKVNEFNRLHEEFISYTRSKQKEKGLCNISGNLEEITGKHRGLLGNAKIISTGPKEAYFGRFRTGSDVIKVGYETSEKAHLMLKYFLENENSSIWIADGQYLINWFSDDISNDSMIDLTNSKKFTDKLDRQAFPEINTDEVIPKEEYTRQFKPSEVNKNIGQSFIKGKKLFSDDSDYYVMILDKSSNGRISIKYYNRLKTASLLENLNNWGERYTWKKYDKATESYIDYVPSLGQILLAAYGIDRDKKLVLDNKGFRKDQLKKMIISVIEGKEIPQNISNMLKLNIRNRIKYKDTWITVMYTSLSILSDGRKEDFEMREIEKQNIDYLYGRLLAIYERIEASVFDKVNDEDAKQDKKEKQNIRKTNAEKFWNAFTNKPASTMKILEDKTKVYESKLEIEKNGLYRKFNKEKINIINEIDKYEIKDKPLGYDFIFGYYAETKYIFTKKEDNKNE